MLMVLHGNDGVHTHNRGSKDILGATTHYTPVMTIKHGTALKSKTDYKLDLMAYGCSKVPLCKRPLMMAGFASASHGPRGSKEFSEKA